MNNSITKRLAGLKSNRIFQGTVIFLGLAVAYYLIYTYYPYSGNDWEKFYGHLFANIRDPYQVEGFVNPPWLSLLLPYGLLPIRYSNALNLLINIVALLIVIRYVKGGWLGIVLTITNPLFWDTMRLNGIEWVPLIGFMLPAAWSMPLLVLKPQSLGLAALIKWKKEKFNWKVLLPLVICLGLSFLIWGNWVRPDLLSMTKFGHNFSFWPVSILFGIYVLYLAWKNNDEILGAAATPMLVPYIGPYSLTCFLAILSGKHKKFAVVLYAVIWWYFIIEGRRNGYWSF